MLNWLLFALAGLIILSVGYQLGYNQAAQDFTSAEADEVRYLSADDDDERDK